MCLTAYAYTYLDRILYGTAKAVLRRNSSKILDGQSTPQNSLSFVTFSYISLNLCFNHVIYLSMCLQLLQKVCLAMTPYCLCLFFLCFFHAMTKKTLSLSNIQTHRVGKSLTMILMIFLHFFATFPPFHRL